MKLEWLGHIFVSSSLVCLVAVLIPCLGSQQQHWQLRIVIALFDTPCQLYAIHLRHHYVRHHQIEALPMDDV